MRGETLGDLVISGVATGSGGTYRNVRIDGVGKVNGDLRAEACDVNGVTTLRGDVEVGRLDADGRVKIEGKLSAGSIELDGMIDVLGAVSGDRIVVHGMMNVVGDVEAESLRGEGGLMIAGMLNAGEIDIGLVALAAVREIGCASIRVRRTANGKWRQLLQWLMPKTKPELQAQTIEGDDIDLEYAVVSVVRGNRVTIGPGCKIGKVEYRGEYRKHPGAQVGEERRYDG